MMETATGNPDPREHALGYAHRRARVFWFWWMGMVFAVPGAVQAMVLAGTGQNPENGLLLAFLGLAISGAGWLMAVGPRFTRSAPQPAHDANRAEQYIRIVPGAVTGMVAAMLVLISVLMVATPRGTSPDVLPILAFLVAFPWQLEHGCCTRGTCISTGTVYIPPGCGAADATTRLTVSCSRIRLLQVPPRKAGTRTS